MTLTEQPRNFEIPELRKHPLNGLKRKPCFLTRPDFQINDPAPQITLVEANEFTRAAVQRQANFFNAGSVDEYLLETLGEALLLVDNSMVSDGSGYETTMRSPEIALRASLIGAAEFVRTVISEQAAMYKLEEEAYISELLMEWLGNHEDQCVVDPVSGIAYRSWYGEKPISNLLPMAITELDHKTERLHWLTNENESQKKLIGELADALACGKADHEIMIDPLYSLLSRAGEAAQSSPHL
jgi:hypothetical protein